MKSRGRNRRSFSRGNSAARRSSAGSRSLAMESLVVTASMLKIKAYRGGFMGTRILFSSLIYQLILIEISRIFEKKF